MRILSTLVLSCAALTAQNSLTTTFANNNGGAAGGGLYFTLTAGVADITITDIDFNIGGAGGATGSMDIYTTPGGHSGNELNAAAWTMVATAPIAASNPVGTGSNAVLSAPLTILAGTSVGIACTDSTLGMAHAYTTGTAPFPLQYAGCGLTLDAGSASNSPFVGTLFTPRVANVTINYTAAGDCATLESVGTGCVTAFSTAYELTTLDQFGLNNTMAGIDFISTGGGYIITPAAGTIAAVGSVDPAAVPLAGVPDDGLVPIGTLGLEISSNGYLTLGAGGNNNWIPTGDRLVNNPFPTFANWSDFQPNTGGTITAEEAGTITQVTYDQVLAWGTTDPNTFQFLYDSASGNCSLYFGAMASATAHPHMVGYSPGAGVVDPGPLANSIEAELAATGAIVLAASDTLPLTLEALNGRPVMGAAPAPYDMSTTNIEATSLFHVGALGLTEIPGGIAIPGTDPSCLLRIAAPILTPASVVAGGPGNLTWTAFDVPAADPTLNGTVINIQSACLDLSLISPSLRLSNIIKAGLGTL